MKRTITLLIATALIFGMSQCKKNVETITPSNQGKTVHITVNVDGGRHEVYPSTGAVVYTDGDKIYVGNGSKYLGTLTYGSGAFSGDITVPAVGDYLYFYFLGGIEISPVAATTSYEISIANQSSQLPVLSFGRSTSTYTTSTATYGCTLLNKCGLVKFTLATATSATVKVTGMKTGVTVNFADPEKAIVANGTRDAITLRNEGTDSERWAILLPQNAVTGGIAKIGENFYSCDVAAVAENSYITTNTIDNTTPTTEKVFTVSTDGNVVRFSPGNLQYQATTNTWQFAENQYDYVGNAAGNTAPSASQSGWIDLFGWGTSGISEYEPIATCYQPWSTSQTNSEYNPYGSTSTNLYDGGSNKGKADWGYNAISNGGNTQNFGWRTLTSAEWAYLINTRSNTTVNGTSNARFTKAAITTPSSTTVNGLILFPDSYSGGTPSGVTWGTINGTDNGYTTTCTAYGWTALEAAGCVFLPAAGKRDGSSVDSAGLRGYYWSSTYRDSDSASLVYFSSNQWGPQIGNSRYTGRSVRLVF